MSIIGDFFNRIKNRFSNNKMLEEAKPYAIDPVLQSHVRKEILSRFENPTNYNEYCQNYFFKDTNFDDQYGYLEVITLMQTNGTMSEFSKYYSEIEQYNGLYYPSEVHGISHTSRVAFFAEALCTLDKLSLHDRDLIMRAAQFHDIGREDDGKNFDHGLASAQKIDQYGILSNYPPRDQELIKFAIANHSLDAEGVEAKLAEIPKKDREDYRKIINYLQDADKLDRTRIANKGWGLDPERLANPTAKRLVKFAHENYYEFYNVINYEQRQEEYQADYDLRVQSFILLRESGYNIPFDDFQNILAEYRPGTLQELLNQGNIKKIFSYDTLQKYGLPDSRMESASEYQTMLKEATEDKVQVIMMEETFNNEFMLYYNLKKNNRDGYNLLNYIDIDKSIGLLAGVASEISLNDYNKIFSEGFNIRLNDLVQLASNMRPEEYRECIDSGNIRDLFSSKYEKNPQKIIDVKNQLRELGLNYPNDVIKQSYRFIQTILKYSPEVLLDQNIRQYSFPELYSAITKLEDAKNRIVDGKFNHFSYDSKNVISLIDYSRQTRIFDSASEKDQLDLVENFVQYGNLTKDPRYVNYVVKKNKPFITKKISEILDYNEYCSDKILEDPNIGLEEAKSKLINGLFTIDVPKENRAQFEKEILESLYYHKKYCPNSQIYEQTDGVIEKITEILESDNIVDFKNNLFENKAKFNLYNISGIGDTIKSDLLDISKKDIAYNLNKTAQKIDEAQYQTVYDTNGTAVNVKVLSGEPFYMATTTAMPKCCSRAHKLFKENLFNMESYRKEVYSNMLNREFVPKDICTSITSNNMVAHAQSSLQDQELIFGFVPDSDKSISILGKYDLSSSRKGDIGRTTDKPITPRGISDFVSTTTEEHNELVMNDVYPRYIICHDKVTDIAIQKLEAMRKEYAQKGINQSLDIVLIESKDKYIPAIKDNIVKEHNDVHRKLLTGNFSDKDFDDLFGRHETDLVLRTLQSIHSTSYRDDVWDEKFNNQALDSLADIISKVSDVVSPEKSRILLDKVDMLLDRADRNSDYGKRFYDHCYADSIDTYSLSNSRRKLIDKVYPYEKTGKKGFQKNQRRGLQLEDMTVDENNQIRNQGQNREDDDSER